MCIPVLVVTSTPGFGALIQQTLEDCGRYQVSLTNDARQAISMSNSTPFGLSILDTSEEGETSGSQGILLEDLVRSLRQNHPEMRLVIVPPQNDRASHPIIEQQPDGTLTKPFYLPDLVDMIDQIMQTKGDPPPPASAQAEMSADQPEPPAWLADVARAAQYLARLSLESAAQAALIISDGNLWAYAGELIQPAAQELAQTVTNHWSRGGSSDLARFIRLEATQSEYMLYATGLGGNMVLGMVFDVETPFSKIRSQASSLAHALASPPGSETAPPVPEIGPRLPRDEHLESNSSPARLPPLFEDVPPPQASGWEYTPRSSASPFSPSEELDESGPDLEEDGLSEAIFPLESSLWLPEDDKDGDQLEGAPAGVSSDPLAETHPVLLGHGSAESLSDGPEIIIDEASGFDSLQSVSAAVCNLNYACMLIPRLPKHHLTGDLGEILSEWVAQLCLAFGWRLGHLAVRPDYLLWIVNVSPTVSPSYLVRMMRQHTSQRIFTHFVELARENPSGDFWAPGYLVMSSTQPPPVEVMNNFIQGTRRRQGATKSSSHSGIAKD